MEICFKTQWKAIIRDGLLKIDSEGCASVGVFVFASQSSRSFREIGNQQKQNRSELRGRVQSSEDDNLSFIFHATDPFLF